MKSLLAFPLTKSNTSADADVVLLVLSKSTLDSPVIPGILENPRTNISLLTSGGIVTVFFKFPWPVKTSTLMDESRCFSRASMICMKFLFDRTPKLSRLVMRSGSIGFFVPWTSRTSSKNRFNSAVAVATNRSPNRVKFLANGIVSESMDTQWSSREKEDRAISIVVKTELPDARAADEMTTEEKLRLNWFCTSSTCKSTRNRVKNPRDDAATLNESLSVPVDFDLSYHSPSGMMKTLVIEDVLLLSWRTSEAVPTATVPVLMFLLMAAFAPPSVFSISSMEISLRESSESTGSSAA